MRFILVHGSMHGAWCFDRLVPELTRRGHQAVAVDLPGLGDRRSENASLEGFRDAVLEALQPGAVLVGHSMGCVAATLGADSFPDLAHIVYLAGPLPIEGAPILEAVQAGVTEEGTRVRVSGGADAYMTLTADGIAATIAPTAARECFYQDCDDDTVDWALARLCPQQIDVLTKPVSVPDFWRRNPRRSYIRCSEDRAVLPEVSALASARLGVRPLTIPGSHSPFLSRPSTLAEVLLQAISTKHLSDLKPT
ncbi:MAG: hypothetical protein QOJ62_3172 [Actinomycetota bacterium]|nr:hypothetical protein [Actinomycetota bacterium]